MSSRTEKMSTFFKEIKKKGTFLKTHSESHSIRPLKWSTQAQEKVKCNDNLFGRARRSGTECNIPERKKYAVPCSANVIFLNLSAHIEILILALVILPSKAVDDTGMLLSVWQKGLREFSREAFGSSHTTNRRRTLHIDQKDKAEAAEGFTILGEMNVKLLFTFLQTCQSKSALFEFYQHEFSWLPPPRPPFL